MNILIENLIYQFSKLTPFGWFRLFLDIYLVWILIYLLLNLIKLNVRTIQLLKGVIFVIFLRFLAVNLNLTALERIMQEIMRWGIILLIIIFQPEIRGALEQIGINSIKGTKKNQQVSLLEIITSSVDFLAKRRIGALILIEKEVKVDDFISTSTIMDSKLSSELLNTIFVPTTPLHDGAVIVRNEQLYCAGAYLPLSTREDIDKSLGTRHRAALGASEITDGIIVIVSEETGTISIAKNGKIMRFDEITAFKETLKSLLN